MSEQLPAQGSAAAFTEFLARYQTIWQTHPAAKLWRKDDAVAAAERRLWAELIDKIEPADFERVIEAVRATMRESGRRGKATLDDIRTAHDELLRQRLAFATPSYAPFVSPDERPVSLEDYVRENAAKHSDSPTFAVLAAIARGEKAQPSQHRVPWLHTPPKVIAAEEPPAASLPDPEPDYEKKEREAIESVENEPW